MKTWRKLALVGFVASVSAAGCVVGSSDDDSDTNNVGGSSGTTAGTGGKGGSGTGGSSAGTGGTGTGGSSGTTGGSSGSGGSGGSTAIQCDPTGALGGTLGSCTPSDTTNACQVCIQQRCCEAWNRCTATTPDNPCGFGGPAGSANGEIGCYQDCALNTQLDGGTPDDPTLAACAGGCATPGCGTIADTTNTLIDCMNTSCFTECIEVQ